MSRRSRYAPAALVGLLALAPPAAAQEPAAPAAPAAPTVDEIVAKNLAARGGEENLAGVESARVTGTMTVGPGMEAPFLWEWKAPGKVRMEFTVGEMTGIQAFDGETAWLVMPFVGKTSPEPMGDDEREMIEDQADFAGPLVDSEAKGYSVALAGPAEVDGIPAWKLEVTDDDGDVTHLYLDRESGLEIQAEATRTLRGQEVETVTTIGDYRRVGDLVLAHSYDMKPKGAPQGQTITFETVELGVELPDSRFAMPAPEETAPDEPAAEGHGGEPAPGDGGR